MIRRTRVSHPSSRRARKSVRAASFDAESFKNRRRAISKNKRDARNPQFIADKISQSSDPMETAFDLLVPSSGKAKTEGGELIRAMMKILYRDFNDGDVFYDGYGVETCGDCVAFICEHLPELEDDFAEIALRTLEGNAYTNALNAIANKLITDLTGDLKDLLASPNSEDMYDSDGEEFMNDRGWIPEYDFECDIPDSILYHLDAGHISARDLIWELESWDFAYHRDCDIHVNDYYITITGLDKDTYDELKRHMYDDLEEYGDALDGEYGSDDEEEEY